MKKLLAFILRILGLGSNLITDYASMAIKASKVIKYLLEHPLTDMATAITATKVDDKVVEFLRRNYDYVVQVLGRVININECYREFAGQSGHNDRFQLLMCIIDEIHQKGIETGKINFIAKEIATEITEQFVKTLDPNVKRDEIASLVQGEYVKQKINTIFESHTKTLL